MSATNTLPGLLSFLNREHYQIYYTPVAKEFGCVEAAIIFSEFIQRHQYHESKGELIDIPDHGGGWFYHTMDKIEERTGIARKGQDRSIKILKKYGLIETIQYGMPCLRYIRFCISACEEFSKNLSRMSKTDKQECPKRTDKNVQNGQTAPGTASLYTKEPKEEPNKEYSPNNQTCTHPASPIRARIPDISFSFEEQKFEGISEKDLKNWKELYPSLDVELTLKEMIQWVLANPSKSKKKKHWRQFIIGWFKRANEHATNKQAYKQINSNQAKPEKDPQIDKHRKWTEEIKRKISLPEEVRMIISDNSVMLEDKLRRISQPVGYAEGNFKEIVTNFLRNREIL